MIHSIKTKCVLVIVVLSTLLSLPSTALAKTTPTPTIDYVATGTSEIQTRLDAINTFIALYKKNSVYFSDQQKRQIETQYSGLQLTFTTIKGNLAKDTDTNLVTDYNAINNGVFFYEEKLPLLYSELFLFKAIYINNKFSAINTTTIPAIIAIIPKENHEQATTLSSDMLTISTNIGTNMQAVTLDYSKLSDAQSKANPTGTFQSIFADIKTNQQTIMAGIKTMNDDFGKLISLY